MPFYGQPETIQLHQLVQKCLKFALSVSSDLCRVEVEKHVAARTQRSSSSPSLAMPEDGARAL